MNAITFATKRAYHAFLRLTRRGLAAVGLTAARFDMLLAAQRRVLRAALRQEGASGAAGQLGSYLTALRVYLGDKAPVVHDWTRSPPLLREYAPPAMMLRDWQPAGTPWRARDRVHEALHVAESRSGSERFAATGV
jgi:hypothetical protein